MRIAVYCGSSKHLAAPYHDAARRLGAAIARAGHTMFYGGGRTGLMGSAADAALAAGGVVEGVILDAFVGMDVHHRGLHRLDEVADMRSRKRALEEGADAFIALPGGLGTLEELAEVLSFRKLGFHARPLVLVDTNGFFQPLVAQIERSIRDGFDDPEMREAFAVTDDPELAVAMCEPGYCTRR
ncbi:MAG TPA: TIGR00730 family Rossman fold protein [Myxococcota bacterium]|nr:TIGR00730 family Rossman fold protein [Myxococcota bacterium]